MEEFKEFLKNCEYNKSPIYSPLFVKSSSEIIPIDNEHKNHLFIPQDLFNENKNDFKEYFDQSSNEYLNVKNTNLHKEIILKNDFSFDLCNLDSLCYSQPNLILNHDLIDTITNTIQHPKKSTDLSIDKQTLLETINNSYKKQKHSNKGKLSHQDFTDFISESYDKCLNKNVTENSHKTEPFKYITEINNLLKLHDKEDEISEHIIYDFNKPKIIEADDFLITKFEDIREKLSITFPFELDDFQKKAVYLIEKKENVLVAAHTSAGKTVMAEYAIASSIQLGKKTIYTSPIKALSNQKFYEFRKKFKDVGIITGDIQINENAQTTVMTTEILRSMLYRDSSKLNDVAYVIFDEVHYINDEERGVVWEEILIMLPKHIRLVLLSATVPNCHEVASWIGGVRHQTINVVITRKRPVPLEHILYYGQSYNTKDDILKVIDSSECFSSANFRMVEEILAARDKSNRTNQKGVFLNKNHIFALVDHLQTQNKLPCIIFIFSRQKCFDVGNLLFSKDFTTKTEKHLIKTFFTTSISRMSEENRNLYQVKLFESLCVRGIAVHHSGVLPILREIVELLFQKELIKVLVATETFAIGVNMPAKTVVFTSLEKFSGNQTRPLLSSEYIQMAGRAGRRGQDTIGSVYILATTSIPSEDEFRSMSMGSALKITSRFRLTYGMILNLLSTSRLDETRVEHVMKSSFNEFIQISCSQEQVKKINSLNEDLARMKSLCNYTECCADLESYIDAILNYMKIWKQILIFSGNSRTQTNHFYLQGRLGFVRVGNSIFARPCLILDFPKSLSKSTELFNDPCLKQISIIFPATSTDPNIDKLLEITEKNSYIIVNEINNYEINSLHITDVILSNIVFLSSKKIKINIPSLNSCINSKNPKMIIIRDQSEALKIRRAFIDFFNDMKNGNIFTINEIELKRAGPIDDAEFSNMCQKYSTAISSLRNNFKCLSCKDIVSHSEKIIDIKKTKSEIDRETLLISDGGLSLLPEYNKRVEILRSLDLIDENLNLTLKGRVAVKFTNNFEIILTELLFDGTLKDLNHCQLAAFLSCFTDQGLVKIETKKGTVNKYELDKIWDRIDQVLYNLDDMERNIQLITCERPVHPKLMEGIYEWALGCDFKQLIKTSKLQEGSLIRFVLRLDEICKELEKAALHIGNIDLKNTAKKARESIRRDIINIPSLYLID